MKRLTILLTLAFIVALILPAFAGNAENGNLSGPHWGFNIIGKKIGGISGDDSNGRTIMVPLKNVTSRNGMTCDVDGVEIFEPGNDPVITSTIPSGTRIYFDVCDDCNICDCHNFGITDRDATDGVGRINVPIDALIGVERYINFDIYLRVLGKPYGCMNINAYAYDADINGGLWFYAGSAYISRKPGKSVFVNANDLFDVQYCSSVDCTSGTCVCTSNVVTKSVFDTAFEDYLWNILNDGTKLVQVRIYLNPVQ